MSVTRRDFLKLGSSALIVTLAGQLYPFSRLALAGTYRYVQPLFIRRKGEYIPVAPIQEAVNWGATWYQSRLTPIVGPVGLYVLPLVSTEAELTTELAQEELYRELRAVITHMGMPDDSDWLYPTLARGIGGWSGTFTGHGAGIAVCGDDAIEAICRFSRPSAVDRSHPDWPEYTKTRSALMGGWFHEWQHGLMEGSDLGLWRNKWGHSPYDANLLSGSWWNWPYCGLAKEEAKTIYNREWPRSTLMRGV